MQQQSIKSSEVLRYQSKQNLKCLIVTTIGRTCKKLEPLEMLRAQWVECINGGGWVMGIKFFFQVFSPKTPVVCIKGLISFY